MITETAYLHWRALAFPTGSANVEVDRLHAGLTYWDALVANSVIPVMDKTERYDAGAIDFDAGLALLRSQVRGLMMNVDGDDRAQLGDYVAYVDALTAANAEVRLLPYPAS